MSSFLRPLYTGKAERALKAMEGRVASPQLGQLTHDAVLRRLRAMENAVQVEAAPVYTAEMKQLRAQMTGGRCRLCQARCPFPRDTGGVRQFYFVTFRIRGTTH